MQSIGKKVLDTIFDACPLVTFAHHRKYGRRAASHVSGSNVHGLIKPVPQSYPLITPRLDRRWIYW